MKKNMSASVMGKAQNEVASSSDSTRVIAKSESKYKHAYDMTERFQTYKSKVKDEVMRQCNVSENELNVCAATLMGTVISDTDSLYMNLQDASIYEPGYFDQFGVEPSSFLTKVKNMAEYEKLLLILYVNIFWSYSFDDYLRMLESFLLKTFLISPFGVNGGC